MNATSPSQQELTEMAQVLQSGVFDKAPRLGKFFAYICDRYFEGKADEIKEYSIALEALGRPTDFDPKKDSIVRVEAHRLRKRLDEFYGGAGASHPLRIIIPNGQYRPHFVVNEPAKAKLGPVETTIIETAAFEARDAAPAQSDLTAATELEAIIAPVSHVLSKRQLLSFLCLALVAISFGFLLVRTLRQKTAKVATSRDEIWDGSPIATSGPDLRLLAGYHGPPYVDRQGHTWISDAYFHGGRSQPIPSDHYIEALPDPHLLKASRFGKFGYDIPLGPGTYELHLFFAETEYGRGNGSGGGEGTRTFRVSVNGHVQLPSLDPLAEAGAANRLHERVLKDITAAVDGKLHLGFEPLSAPAVLSGIELLPSAPGRIHPVRIVAQASPVTDSDGRLWAADEYFCGGTSVFRENIILNPNERGIFHGERYGNFTYRIPLAPGRYRVTLHFAEQWFGTPASAMEPIDSRAFDVFANGVALLRNFVVGYEAHGANRPVERAVDGLQPNAQGILQLEFVPVKNYAEVNAIEVVETD